MESSHDPNQTADSAVPARPSLPDYRTPSSEHRAILDAALTEFSNRGYYEGRLDNISLESGISKRMIHYHFGDKRGLYLETLRLAANRLRPTDAELISFSGVPVDAVRLLVDTIVDRFLGEPRATRLLAMENLFGILDVDTELSILGQSPIVLMIDKLLMHGLDYGAFRPGVSAIDIYLMMNSLAMFPSFNRRSFRSLYGVDLNDIENRRGLRRLISDAVISFLTSTLPSKPTDSYLPTSRGMHQGVHPVDPYDHDDDAGSEAIAPSLSTEASPRAGINTGDMAASSDVPATTTSEDGVAARHTSDSSSEVSDSDSGTDLPSARRHSGENATDDVSGSMASSYDAKNVISAVASPSELKSELGPTPTETSDSPPACDTNALALDVHNSIYPLDDPSQDESYEQFNGLGDGGTSFDQELSGNSEVEFGSRTPSSRRAVQVGPATNCSTKSSDATPRDAKSEGTTITDDDDEDDLFSHGSLSSIYDEE